MNKRLIIAGRSEKNLMLEENYTFDCPYCSAAISMMIDHTGGKKQSFVYDCEVCCRPIDIHLELDSEEIIHFTAQRQLD